MFQETLKELFPSWQAVSKRYREVVIFVAGLMKDSRSLVQFVYEMQVEHYLNEMRAPFGYTPSIDTNLIKWLHAESTVRLFDHPLHNKYINYYNHSPIDDPSETTPVYFPSRLYHFMHVEHRLVLENHLTDSSEIPPCVMNIRYPAVRDSLLSICSQIWKHQPVTDLYMKFVTCNSLEAPKLTKPVMVHLTGCKFPEVFIKMLLRQLIECHCGETLQKLELIFMDLGPFESLLDELLEDLVAHHEAGLAQRKLWLELVGNKIFNKRTNLSEEFVEKWRNRCEKVDSIDCTIDP